MRVEIGTISLNSFYAAHVSPLGMFRQMQLMLSKRSVLTGKCSANPPKSRADKNWFQEN
jgi:hypothetical protein